MPCSNECPSTLALELCETVEEASLRLLAEFRVRAQKTRTVLRDLKLSGPIARPHRAAHLLQKHTAAAMLPMRDFRRRRRRRFAPLGQPLIFFWLAALLVQAAAQPHAREDHAQHIMNQARANQKASRAVCAILASAAASTPSRSEGRRIDGARVASMAYGPPTSVTNAGARSSSASGSAASTRRARRLQKPTT